MAFRVCKNCKFVFEGSECPNCKSTDYADNFKGKIYVLNEEQFEIVKNLKIKGKGTFALKIG